MFTDPIEPVVVSIVALVFLVVVVGVSMVNGVDIGKREMRNEAIKAGVARWVGDEDGDPKFEWILRGEDR